MVIGIERHTGYQLAEVAYLLILFGGVWLVAAQVRFVGFARGRTFVAGLAFGVAGLLLIVATHWAHFG